MLAKDLCNFGKQSGTFVVDPAVMYPTVVKHVRERKHQSRVTMREALAGRVDPNAVVTPEFEQLHLRLQRISDEDFELALAPAQEVPKKKREIRAEVLEVARLWFQRQLHIEVNAGRKKPLPIHIHIMADDRFRL